MHFVYIAQAQHLNHLNWPFQPVGTVAQGQGPIGAESQLQQDTKPPPLPHLCEELILPQRQKKKKKQEEEDGKPRPASAIPAASRLAGSRACRRQTLMIAEV